LALSKGANIIEKHFTLNKKFEGPDHALSADEYDLKLICEFAKNINILSGTGKINPTVKELKIKKLARKSIFVKKDISKNEFFTEANLEIRRPKGFFDPISLNKIINNKSIKKIKAGTNLRASYIKNFYRN
jgi:N,N'-diacetyllegionaminate synthase